MTNVRETVARLLFAGEGVVLPKATGVYVIVNKRNERIYIGSAINIESRARNHLKHLAARTHSNRRLQADWLLHGSDAFLFGVLLLCDRTARKAQEVSLLRQVIGEGCYNWSLIGPRTRHDALPPEQQQQPGTSKAAKRVSASRARLRESGGRRVQTYLQPDAADALQRLLDAGYADNAAAAVSAALVDAARKVGRR